MYATDRPKPSARTRVIMIGALFALLVGAVVLLAGDLGREDSSPIDIGAGEAGEAPPDELEPLLLRPGVYRYTVQDLGSEATTADGEVLSPATSQPAQSWELRYSANGEWEERNVTGRPAIHRSYRGGRHDMSVNGRAAEPPAHPPIENERAAAAAGSALPKGGPRIEFNPYGASFLRHLEIGANTSAGPGRSSRLISHEPCGEHTCVREVFERVIERPPEDTEYFRSLPWSDQNVERAELVYEEDTQLVHRYETSLNGVTLHSFILKARPSAV